MMMLEEIDQLKQSGFGRPQPRHGLKLLYWFATDCLTLDQNYALKLSCYPGNGDFGFHLFLNRYDRNGWKLLPDVTFNYYVVGNLSKRGAYNLPPYVREHYNKDINNSNKDRIIISSINMSVYTVYVTEHSDQSNFNKRATYQISKRLIMIIRGLRLDEFLQRTGYSNRPSTIAVKPSTHWSNSQAQYQAPSTTFSSTSSTSSTSALMTSRNQDIDIEAARGDKPNPREERRCYCTIL
ncbi:uncharacterized protein LOC131351308 [Hemibagrus wyckioides]|uniref:uncharacterized protein LOC131351308 n=1 Tax=Hemibagrus wyckioides TaxID=337641 RepID=UPI00266DCEF1|nr:uncharacterized protein LOC131351308 [Hemibagrus wyckioides]